MCWRLNGIKLYSDQIWIEFYKLLKFSRILFCCRSLLTERNLPLPKVPVIFLKPTSSYVTEGQCIEVSFYFFLFGNIQRPRLKHDASNYKYSFRVVFLFSLEIVCLNFQIIRISRRSRIALSVYWLGSGVKICGNVVWYVARARDLHVYFFQSVQNGFWVYSAYYL